MASTYSDRLKLELMETGANANTWGNNTNTNLQTVDAFTAGYLSKDVGGSVNVTLSSNNADPNADASNKVLDLNGTLTGNITVFVPQVENNYLVYNNTSGSFTLDVAATGGTGVEIAQGSYSWIYCDGTNVQSAELGTNASAISSGTLADARLSANVTLNNASTISTGTLAQARLANSTITINGNAIALGGAVTVGDITGVTAGVNLTGGGTTGTVTLDMATGGVGSGTYGSTANGTKIDTITVDAYGRVTAVATGATGSGDGDITGVTAGTGLTGGGTSGSVTLAVSTTAGGVGTYSFLANKTTDEGGGSTILAGATATISSGNVTPAYVGGSTVKDSGSGPSAGTWRNMGPDLTPDSGGTQFPRGTIFLRIS